MPPTRAHGPVLRQELLEEDVAKDVEYVDSQALSPEGTFVRYDGEGRPPVADGPFAETKDLTAGWMVIDVDTYERRRRVVGSPRSRR